MRYVYAQRDASGAPSRTALMPNARTSYSSSSSILGRVEAASLRHRLSAWLTGAHGRGACTCASLGPTLGLAPGRSLRLWERAGPPGPWRPLRVRARGLNLSGRTIGGLIASTALGVTSTKALLGRITTVATAETCALVKP